MRADMGLPRITQSIAAVTPAEAAVPAVQVPAAHQRPGPECAQHRQLVLDRRHLGVQAHAEGGAHAAQHVGEGGAEQLWVAHFDRNHGIGRGRLQAGQCLEHLADADEQRGLVGQQLRRDRAQLKYQRADAVAQPFQSRLHELLDRDLAVQEHRIGLRAAAAFVAHGGVGHKARRLHHEAEVVGHHGRIARVLAGRERAVEVAVQAHGAKERMPGEGGQTALRQHRFGVFAIPDEVGPARVAP